MCAAGWKEREKRRKPTPPATEIGLNWKQPDRIGLLSQRRVCAPHTAPAMHIKKLSHPLLLFLFGVSRSLNARTPRTSCSAAASTTRGWSGGAGGAPPRWIEITSPQMLTNNFIRAWRIFRAPRVLLCCWKLDSFDSYRRRRWPAFYYHYRASL